MMMKKGWDGGTLLPGRFPTTPANGLLGPQGLLGGYRARGEAAADLCPLVTVVPSMGTHPHADTVPRARHPAPLRLSSSDNSSLKGGGAAARPLGPTSSSSSSSSHVRLHSTDAVLTRSNRGAVTFEGVALKRPAPPTKGAEIQRLSALPPLAPPRGESASLETSSQDTKSERSNDDECASDVTEDDSDIDEDLSSTESLVPPAAAGFEPKSSSTPQPPCVQFPDAVDLRAPFPATIVQDHVQLEAERCAATATGGSGGAGLSQRANNVVRAYLVHGPLDRQLLGKAVEQVANLHPILSATFQRWKDRLYLQTSQGRFPVGVESPLVGHEEASDLITTARRKLFVLTMRSDMMATEGGGTDLKKKLSVVSLSGSDEGAAATALPPIVGGVSGGSTHRPPTSKKKTVTFSDRDGLHPPPPSSTVPQPPLPPIPSSFVSAPPSSIFAAVDPPPLIRARLVPKSDQEHILVLSFPQVVCDFWSSCLFVHQLVDCYSKMEQSHSYRPSMATLRAEERRQAVVAAFEHERGVGGGGGRATPLAKPAAPSFPFPGRAIPRAPTVANSLLIHRKPAPPTGGDATGYVPPHPARFQFQQVAHRESQLLKMVPRERLWSFWQSMATITIHRQRGPPRVKVIPPVRLPSGLGARTVKKLHPPSALRPLTARARPQSGRKGSSSGVGVAYELLTGPQTQFHFLKAVGGLWSSFTKNLPETYLGSVGGRGGGGGDDLLPLLCLAVYAVLLGRCCRGWGGSGCSKDPTAVPPKTHEGMEEETAPPLREGSLNPVGGASEGVGGGMPGVSQEPVVASGGAKRPGIRGLLDLGTFLIGVDMSLREVFPDLLVGVFGPLTNNVGLKVNLSSSETFANLVVVLGKTLQAAQSHSHFPFSTVAEELGLVKGLPIRFAYFRQQDVIQLTSPSNFYFAETAVGVEGHGLARLGTRCYLTPLNSKMDDNCHMELVLWENEGGNVAGGFRYQPQAIRPDLVKLFADEYTRLLDIISAQPCIPLGDLASLINPPFVSTSKSRSRNIS